MKTIVLISLLLACAFTFQLVNVEDEQTVGDVNWPFKSCGTGDFTVSKFTWQSTPAAGKKMKFTISGTAKNAISPVEASISLSINGLPINVIVDPWKASYAKGAAVSYTYDYQLPSSSGSYGNMVAFYNAKDQTLACVSITYKF